MKFLVQVKWSDSCSYLYISIISYIILEVVMVLTVHTVTHSFKHSSSFEIVTTVYILFIHLSIIYCTYPDTLLKISFLLAIIAVV